jgi:hypothetical protein
MRGSVMQVLGYVVVAADVCVYVVLFDHAADTGPAVEHGRGNGRSSAATWAGLVMVKEHFLYVVDKPL